MIFELKKPLYGWRTLEPDQGYDLFLSEEVIKWLDLQNIKYETHRLVKKRDIGEGLNSYLFFYIDIWNDQEAMLFKLTWM